MKKRFVPIIFLIAKIGSIYLTAAGFLYLFWMWLQQKEYCRYFTEASAYSRRPLPY